MRKPRIRYGAPIVMTIAASAAAAGCATQTPPGNPPPPEHHIHTNPPPQHHPVETPTATPSGAPTVKVGDNLPPASGKGRIEKQADGTCIEYPDLSNFACPQGATCNPPPPKRVRCP